MARGPDRVLDVGEGDRAAGGRERVVGGDGQQDAFADQVEPVDVAIPRRRHGVVVEPDHDVHGPRAQLLQGGRGLALEDLDVQVRRRRRQRGQRRRQQ